MPYPHLQEQIRDLVAEHAQLRDQPLLVAIYFASQYAPDEECVFEVTQHFGFDEVSDDHRVFQVQFGPTPNFPMPQGDWLRLFLTNPVEFRCALADRWPETEDLRQAIARGQFMILHRDDTDAETARILDALDVHLVAA